jgi:hypothetical protein
MAAAVQQLPSLVDTLQAGSWLTSQEAAGRTSLTCQGLPFALDASDGLSILL